MKPAIYLESTVISYFASRPSRDLINAAHQQITHTFWNHHIHKFKCYISEFVLEEISRGDTQAAKERNRIASDFSILKVTPETLNLAERYFQDISIPQKAKTDTFHLAIAVLNGMDFIVSWNFAHIVNARVQRAIEDINFELGIKTPIICTPEELLEE